MVEFFTTMAAVAVGDLLAVAACVFLYTHAKTKKKDVPKAVETEIPEEDPLVETEEYDKKEVDK